MVELQLLLAGVGEVEPHLARGAGRDCLDEDLLGHVGAAAHPAQALVRCVVPSFTGGVPAPDVN